MSACLVCGRQAAPLEAARWRCRACGLVFTDPLDAPLASLYEGTGSDGTADAIDERRRPLFTALLGRLPPFGGGRCLDVGSGGGLFVRLAAAAGWDAVGVDPAGPALTSGRARLVRMAFPPTGRVPGAPFALVTFNGSLNYMTDPLAALRAAYGLLEPSGLLLVRVPNVAVHRAVRRVAGLLGDRTRLGPWLRRGTIVHARAFTPGALRVALERAGFADVVVRPSPPVPGDPYQSGAAAIRPVKAVVGALARAVATASAGRVLWSPSLEARGVRGR
jgi:SAM-dependent methyltransferase